MVKITVDGKVLDFPFDAYPEQTELMSALKKILEFPGVGLVEYPPGFGKILALLCYLNTENPPQVILSVRHPNKVNQVLTQLKLLDFKGTAVPYLFRHDLCRSTFAQAYETESKCRENCAPIRSPELKGVFNVEDLKLLGEQKNACPFHLAFDLAKRSRVIVCTHKFLLNQKIKKKEGSVLVIDDAYKLDELCMDRLSVNLDRKDLTDTFVKLKEIKDIIQQTRFAYKEVFEEEYKKFKHSKLKDLLGELNPGIYEFAPQAVLDSKLPGNLRHPEHFLGVLKRLSVYLRSLIRGKEAKMHSTSTFLYYLKLSTFIDPVTLAYVSFRLSYLIKTLKLKSIHHFGSLQGLCDFASLLGMFKSGFGIVIETYPNSPEQYFPIIQLFCLNPSLVLEPCLAKFKHSVLVSYSFEPPELYCKLLGIQPVHIARVKCSRALTCPLMLTKGSDQLAVSSKFEERDDEGVMRNYGDLLVELACNIPDGIVCFFPGFRYMEDVVLKWNETGLLHRLLEAKLVFFESRNKEETRGALKNFKKACSGGRGAVMMCVSRGWIAENLELHTHYSRTAIVFGLPHPSSLIKTLKAKLFYFKEVYSIEETDYLNFDVMRQSVHCLSQVLSTPNDYVVQVFADKRFANTQKVQNLPSWVRNNMNETHWNLSTDQLLSLALDFIKHSAKR